MTALFPADKLALHPRKLRETSRLNQHDFWQKVGVTQSTGCRYEAGKPMPVSVKMLLQLVYVEQVPLKQLNGMDMAIGALMRNEFQGLYDNLAAGLHAQKQQDD